MELLTSDDTQIVGVIGFIFYMSSYFLLLTGKIDGTHNCYILMNFTAASLVLISLIHNFNLASALIQICWITISIVGLIRHNLLQKNINSRPKLPAETI